MSNKAAYNNSSSCIAYAVEEHVQGVLCGSTIHHITQITLKTNGLQEAIYLRSSTGSPEFY